MGGFKSSDKIVGSPGIMQKVDEGSIDIDVNDINNTCKNSSGDMMRI